MCSFLLVSRAAVALSTRPLGFPCRSVEMILVPGWRTPALVRRPYDVTRDLECVLHVAEQGLGLPRHRRQLRHRPAVLGDYDRLASSGDLVHKLEALGLEHRRGNNHVNAQ